jgi:hypothetical protein
MILAFKQSFFERGEVAFLQGVCVFHRVFWMVNCGGFVVIDGTNVVFERMFFAC